MARSAASNSRCSACGSLRRSMPLSRLNSSASQSTMRWSKSSPPRWPSPLVERTSTTPSPTSRMRDVEGAAAEVEDQHGLLALLVEPVGQRGRGRLVDDPQHLEPGDRAGVLGRLALRVVEVRRHGDDRLGDLLAEELAGVVGQLAQDQRGDLLGRVLLAADLEAHGVVRARDDLVGDDLRLLVDLVPLAPDEALGRVDRALGVEDRLAPGDLPTSRWPSSVNATTDGVVRAPSAFGITSAWPPSIVRRPPSWSCPDRCRLPWP